MRRRDFLKGLAVLLGVVPAAVAEPESSTKSSPIFRQGKIAGFFGGGRSLLVELENDDQVTAISHSWRQGQHWIGQHVWIVFDQESQLWHAWQWEAKA